jgi:hypothetical protein
MTHPSRSGGQILVDALQVHGVDTAFGVPGESYLDVLDALHDSDIRFVINRQEGGAAFMADAYGKLTGKPGICFVTRGPGATNASIGVHTAYQDSTPMILFIGQVGTDFMDREAFQEIDYRRMYGQMAKWVAQIDRADRIPEYIARAFQVATSGRPGPVVLALPEDMLITRPKWPTRAATSRCRLALRGADRHPAHHAGRKRKSRCCCWAAAPGPRSLRRRAAVCRSERPAGGLRLPLPGPARQRASALRRRRRHRHQSEAGGAREGSRRADRLRPAPGRDDHQRLFAAGFAGAAAAPGAHPPGSAGAGQRLPGRADDRRRRAADGARCWRRWNRSIPPPGVTRSRKRRPSCAPGSSSRRSSRMAARRWTCGSWCRTCRRPCPTTPSSPTAPATTRPGRTATGATAHAHPAGADQRRDGLWRAGRRRGQDRASGAHRGHLCRRRRIHDDRPGTGDRRAVQAPA